MSNSQCRRAGRASKDYGKGQIICSCCYNKTSRPEDSFTPPYYSTLENDKELRQALPRIQRLAETSQDAATSRPAALSPGWQVRLEAFCPEYSARNLVLVGTKASSGVGINAAEDKLKLY